MRRLQDRETARKLLLALLPKGTLKDSCVQGITGQMARRQGRTLVWQNTQIFHSVDLVAIQGNEAKTFGDNAETVVEV